MRRSPSFWVSYCRLYTRPVEARLGAAHGGRVDAPGAVWYSQPNEPGEDRLRRRGIFPETLAAPRAVAAARSGGQALAGPTGAGDRAAGFELCPAAGGHLLSAGL